MIPKTKLKWRYVTAGALLLVAVVLASIEFTTGGALFPGPSVLEVVVAVYATGACVWAFGAGLDHIRLAWRLPLIWLPAVVPIGWMAEAAYAETRDDTAAIVVALLTLPVILIVLACLTATALALVRDGVGGHRR